MLEDLLPGIKLWVEEGIYPGSFLTAVLENNLCEAFGRADVFNRMDMFRIVQHLYNKVPAPAWGSPEKMNAWAKRIREAKAATIGGDDGIDNKKDGNIRPGRNGGNGPQGSGSDIEKQILHDESRFEGRWISPESERAIRD